MPGFRIKAGSQTAGSGPLATTEIARKHRWAITVFGNDTDSLMPIGLYAFKASRPKREFDEITFHHGQQEIYLPGKDRWSPVEFSFYEAVRSDTRGGNPVGRITAFMWDWQQDVSRSGGIVSGGAIPAAIGVSFKRTVRYQMQAPGSPGRWSASGGAGGTRTNPPVGAWSGGVCAVSIWEYVLLNAWPIRVTPSDLDYSDNALAETAVELRFDRAVEG